MGLPAQREAERWLNSQLNHMERTKLDLRKHLLDGRGFRLGGVPVFPRVGVSRPC